ncbi:MAG: hypothetical protein ACQESF_00170 [Nanobdellota archaeon]
MLIKKRVICSFLLFFVVVLSISSYAVEETGYCSNPIIQSVCSDDSVLITECCPENFEGYGGAGYPSGVEDCKNNYFAADSIDNIENCEKGSCFIDGEANCLKGAYIATCYYEGGTPSTTSWDENPQCMEGCCCYEEDSVQESLISTQGYCGNNPSSTFYSEIEDSDACSAECSASDPGEGEPGGDDDDDETPSETSECGNMPYCEIEGPLAGSCCCDGEVCENGEFCCEGSCFSVPCDEVCERSEPCGTTDENGCPLFKKCFPNGSLAKECTPRPSCTSGFEVCDTPEDDDGDGKINCQEAFCDGMVCAETEAEKSENCPDNSYYDASEGVYRCCFGLDLNDCDGEDGPDTCGECNCLENPRSPVLDPIEVVRGQRGVDIRWHLNCEGVNYRLMRCEGEENCDNNVFNLRTQTSKSTFYDEGIKENTKYCYYVKAIYPNAGAEGMVIKKSDEKCFTSGDSVCMEVSGSSFCLDETEGFADKLVLRATCTQENVLSVQENCIQSHDENYVCRGPFPPYGQTDCVYQSPCEECGNPFGVFADYDESSTSLGEGGEGFCKNAQTCYFDYTPTSIDNFQKCSQVQTCYDYKSKSACEGQASKAEEQGGLGSNNKCLPRDCKWKDFEDLSTGGICVEKSDEFRDCQSCNEAEYNDIFGACNVDMCSLFGDCYLRNADYKCVSKDKISCKDYQTPEECMGGSELQVDVEYEEGSRVSGTNNIEQQSGDTLGFGVCRWDDSKNPSCFKDADFNSFKDPSPGGSSFDMTPPNTTILSGRYTKDLNLSFEVTDFNPDGSKGSGVEHWDVFFCKTKKGEAPCYPNSYPEKLDNGKGWVYLGGGTGVYEVYYYSMDKAHNLEKVKKKEFEIDMSAPEIEISSFVNEDLSEFINSEIMFFVNTSESTHCWDYFEQTTDSQITGDTWGDKWTTKYSGLTDGTYEYKVVCEDRAGNRNQEVVSVRVNADSFIDNTLPEGKIDYSDITLMAETLKDTNCKWGPTPKDYNKLPYTFSKMKEVDGYFQHTSSPDVVSESKTYSFDVKCMDGDRVSDDEIQFVYDNKSPVTTVVDSNNKPIDFSSWYSGAAAKNKFFLACNDSPENGFGCDETFYCIDYNNDVCVPNKKISPDQPLPLDFSNSDSFRLCYKSTENVLNEMGGKSETAVCKEIQIDTNPPVVVVDSLNAYKDPSKPKQINTPSYTLEGEVIDPDVVNDVSENFVDIVVEHKKSGNTSVYDDIPANPDFLKDIRIEEELNVITLFATDRSGAKSGSVKYYLYYTPYEGEMISLSRPAFGVSASKEFVFEVETYSSADCRYSLTGQKNEAIDMVSYTDSGKFLHKTKKDLDLSWLSENVKHPVTVFCSFGGREFEKEFQISWDTTRPDITDVYLERVREGNPPALIEFPLESNLVVKTDDKAICKYTEDPSLEYYNTGQNTFPGYYDSNFSKVNKILLDDLVDGNSYTFYVQCENAVTDESITLSPRKTYRFKVDTSLSTGIVLVSPKDPVSTTSIELKIRTTKSASWCEAEYNGETKNMSSSGEEEFSATFENVALGENDFDVSCLTAGEMAEDHYNILVDTTPPSSPSINDGNVSSNLESLSASWHASDNETDVVQYKYAIGSMPGSADVLGWKNTSDDNAVAGGLNLTKMETYYWMVKAKNEVGLWGDSSVSDGVLLNPDSDDISNKGSSGDTGHCSNGILDEDESDVDCGGKDCPSCSFNSTCVLDSDCASTNCVSGKCAKPTCDDNITNQDESDVDCGGNCSPCSNGKGCSVDKDCVSGFCDYGTCFEPNCNDGVKNGGEEGVDCGGPCNNSCESMQPSTCEIDGKKDTDCDGIPDEWELKYSEHLDMHNAQDANLDPDGDGRTNLEEYMDGTNPTKAEKSQEKSSYWLLILLIILILLGFIVVCVLSYKYFYYKIPPKYRKYLDVVVQPIASSINRAFEKIKPFLNRAKTFCSNMLEKSGLAPFLRKYGIYSDAKGKAPYSSPAPSPKITKKSVAFTKDAQKQKGASKVPAKGQKTNPNLGNDYKDTASTKEMIQQIRKKRQAEKQKQRQEVFSEFDESTKEKQKPRKRGLFDRVKKEFDKYSKK